MRKSTMRARLGELEQMLSDRTVERNIATDRAVLAELRLHDAERRIANAATTATNALGQMNPLTQAAVHLASVRAALVEK